MNKRNAIIVMLLMMLASCATQQERAERMAQRQKTVTEAVEKRQWRIDVNSMHTMRYGSKTVSLDFFLELRNDTLRSYLPYLGQAHRAPMGLPEQGLNFETQVLQYQQNKQKEHLYEIEIKVRTQQDAYNYWVEIFDSGEANIRVRSNDRDPISFDGNMNVE